MAEVNITQAEADALIAIEKHRTNEDRNDFPMGGSRSSCRSSPPTIESSFCWTCAAAELISSRLECRAVGAR